MKQYYHIQFRSEFLYNDDMKIVVSSQKELKEYVKNHIDDMMKYYNHPQYDNLRDENYFNQEKKDKVRKIYKVIKSSTMYCDTKNGKTIRTGIVYSKEYLPTEKYMDKNGDYGRYDLMSYWCSRIPKKDLIHYSGFDEIAN